MEKLITFEANELRQYSDISEFFCKHQRTAEINKGDWLFDKKAQWSGALVYYVSRSQISTKLQKGLALFYETFTVVGMTLMVLAAWQLFSANATLSVPASIVLLFGGLGLVIESYFGFKADLAAAKDKGHAFQRITRVVPKGCSNHM